MPKRGTGGSRKRVHARRLVRGRGAAALRRRLERFALRGDGTAAAFDQALAAVPKAIKQQMEEARTHEQTDRDDA